MQQTGKLSAKLVGIQVFFLAVALVSIGLTLLVSWRLEGSAAAINDAGSLRMRTYRLAYLAQEARPAAREPVGQRVADPRRHRRVRGGGRDAAHRRPGASAVRAAHRRDRRAVRRARPRVEGPASPALVRAADGRRPRRRTATRIEQFVAVVNTLVGTLEQDIAQATSLLRTIQLALVALAIIGAVALIYLSFLFIIRPVHQLEDGLQRMAQGDFGVRLPVESKDEFGALASGFNHMAEELEESYRTLERRVADKTQSLAQQNARLATLYDMTALLNAPSDAGRPLPRVPARLLAVAGAAAGAVRLVSRDGETLHLFVEDGLPPAFARQGALPRARRVRLRRGGGAQRGGRSTSLEREAHADQRSRCRTAARRASPRSRRSRSPPSSRCWASSTCSTARRATIASEERHLLRQPRPEPRRRDREPAPRVARARARDRRGAQPARPGAARLDRAVARLPQPADADAAQGAGRDRTRRDRARPGRDPGRRAGVLRRRARAAGPLPHPDRRRRRRARRAHAARPASSTRRASRPSSRRPARRCRSRPTTSCR